MVNVSLANIDTGIDPRLAGSLGPASGHAGEVNPSVCALLRFCKKVQLEPEWQAAHVAGTHKPDRRMKAWSKAPNSSCSSAPKSSTAVDPIEPRVALKSPPTNRGLPLSRRSKRTVVSSHHWLTMALSVPRWGACRDAKQSCTLPECNSMSSRRLSACSTENISLANTTGVASAPPTGLTRRKPSLNHNSTPSWPAAEPDENRRKPPVRKKPASVRASCSAAACTAAWPSESARRAGRPATRANPAVVASSKEAPARESTLYVAK